MFVDQAPAVRLPYLSTISFTRCNFLNAALLSRHVVERIWELLAKLLEFYSC